MLRAATFTCSDRAGESLIISSNCRSAFRLNAVISTESSATLFIFSIFAMRYGSLEVNSTIRNRRKPSIRTRTVLSGNFNIFNTRAAQPCVHKSCGTGLSTAGFFCRTSPRKRSPATTSSINRMLCVVSTRSGATIPGKMTMSESPRIGRFSGKDLDQTFVPEGSALPAEPRISISWESGGVIIPLYH